MNDTSIGIGGDNPVTNAIKILQLKTIATLRKEIWDLKTENIKKEGEKQVLEEKEIKSLASIEKIKIDNNKEIEKMKEVCEEKIESLKKNFIEKEAILSNELNGKEGLLEYVFSVLQESEELMQLWQNTINTQAQEINENNERMEECLSIKNVMIQSQETIRTQSTNIDRLELIVITHENLTKSYGNLAKQDLAKNDCEVAPWMSTLSEALTTQKKEIDTLEQYFDDKKGIEANLRNIENKILSLRNSAKLESTNLVEKYQELIEKQSKSLSMLRRLLTINKSSTHGLQYEEDDQGRVISAATCQCVPNPPMSSGLKMSEIKFDCKGATYGSYVINCSEDKCRTDTWPTCEIVDEENDAIAWEYIDCHEVVVPYLNKSVSCGRGGRKFGMLTSLVGHGFFNQEIPAMPCSDCDEHMFQWTSWSRVGDRRQRTRGSQSVGDSYQEEERKEICNPGWSEFADRCYKLLDNDGQYYKDRAVCDKECKKMGGMLTSIHSKAENDFLKNILKSNGKEKNTFIGGDEKGRKKFVWADGTKWDYENWLKGDPNGGQGCVWLGYEKSDLGKWIDGQCNYDSMQCICKLTIEE